MKGGTSTGRQKKIVRSNDNRADKGEVAGRKERR